MKKLWQKYIEWHDKNRRKQFEWWSRKRAQGHPKWVVTIMLVLGVIGTSKEALKSYYSPGGFDVWELPFETIGYLIVGLIIGATSWWQHERNYQKFLKNRDNTRDRAK